MFVNQGIQTGLWNAIDNLFNLGRIVVTIAFLFEYIRRKRTLRTITGICAVTYFLSCCIVCTLNGTIYFGYVFNGVTYVGLALLCERMLEKSDKLFENVVYYLFGFYSILGAILNLLFQNGFNHAPKPIAIYFLGSKNASFFYFIIFLYLFILRYIRQEKMRGKLLIPILLLAGVYACDSKGGLVCLGVAVIYYYVIHFWKRLYKFIKPVPLIITVSIIFYIVVFSPNVSWLSDALSLIGKDLEYGGRSVLWEYALKMYMAHPLLGNGATLELMNRTVQTQAHNFYIDNLIRYGTIPLIVILVNVIFVAIKVSKEKIRKLLL